uniref:DNA2/NAM7 helicase helicase domain-containing protein n=1 Tax=Aegilops tauschii subsp. strangulata TaxID=200361 RepID=A0A453CL31_AEGTS
MENHSPSLKLIRGPPGTGKTKTISTILWAMLIKGVKTLTCAPTNTAVLEVASRIVRLVRESSDGSVCFLNDIVLFGNKERMKIDDSHDLSTVFLDSRAKRLLPCFVPHSGWRHCLCSLIDLLENPVTKYKLHIEQVPFKNYLKDRYNKLSKDLRCCIEKLYNDHPRKSEAAQIFQCMLEVLELIKILHPLINRDRGNDDIWSEELLEGKVEEDCNPVSWPEKLACVRTNTCSKSKFKLARSLCVQGLRYLCKNFILPDFYSRRGVQFYLLQRAECILCTVFSSFRLYNPENLNLGLLIVDEAAQLKECETLIPLLLPGIKQAVFIGDEYQLPALVKSKISDNAKFGRSVF